MIFGLAQPMGWDCLIVGLLLLGCFDCLDILVHHIQSLSNVTVATIACNDIWPVMLLWQPELLFTVGLKYLTALVAA
jgi:hypothetical protein